MTTYRIGWDILFPDPGELDSWNCRTCGAPCDVQRNLFACTDKYGAAPKRLHDKFACPNAGKDWHGQAYKLHSAAEGMPSARVRQLMLEDLDELLVMHAAEGACGSSFRSLLRPSQNETG